MLGRLLYRPKKPGEEELKNIDLTPFYQVEDALLGVVPRGASVILYIHRVDENIDSCFSFCGQLSLLSGVLSVDPVYSGGSGVPRLLHRDRQTL